MIPALVMLANTVPSPYRPPNRWETLFDVSPVPPEVPTPLNADGTGRVITSDDLRQYVVNGEWELLHPESGP